MKSGMVSLVGAGCGDPALLTLKGQKRLQDCQVLVYDSLVSEGIVSQVPTDCEKIYVGKRYGSHAMKQEEINALLVQKAQEGKRVVRLKGGDPYVFGRGGEEFCALQKAGIFCEEIPGITSCVAVPAAAGIPVTHRGMSRSFTVVTGTTAKEQGREGLELDFETLARLDGTLVILMGLHHLEEIGQRLMEAGKAPETPCAVIMEGTNAGQRCVRAPLFQIAERVREARLQSPAVIVIGAAAQLELLAASGEEASAAPGTKGWEEAPPAYDAKTPENFLPLRNVTVGVTGTPHFVRKLSPLLEEKGAAVADMGFLEIREGALPLPKLCRYGWLVFTSPNGVKLFLEKMKREQRDLRSLAKNRIAVIGPGTAEALEAAGIYADYMPDCYDAVHLAEGLTERILQEEVSAPTLFLRAAQGSEALPRDFEKQGLSFTDFPLYEIGVDKERRKLALCETPDYLVFGSGSGVQAYFEGKNGSTAEEKTADRLHMDEKTTSDIVQQAADKRHTRYVCMGEACGRKLAEYTDEVFLTAQESSAAGIVECICADVRREACFRERRKQ